MPCQTSVKPTLQHRTTQPAALPTSRVNPEHHRLHGPSTSQPTTSRADCPSLVLAPHRAPSPATTQSRPSRLAYPRRPLTRLPDPDRSHQGMPRPRSPLPDSSTLVIPCRDAPARPTFPSHHFPTPARRLTPSATPRPAPHAIRNPTPHAATSRRHPSQPATSRQPSPVRGTSSQARADYPLRAAPRLVIVRPTTPTRPSASQVSSGPSRQGESRLATPHQPLSRPTPPDSAALVASPQRHPARLASPPPPSTVQDTPGRQRQALARLPAPVPVSPTRHHSSVHATPPLPRPD